MTRTLALGFALTLTAPLAAQAPPQAPPVREVAAATASSDSGRPESGGGDRGPLSYGEAYAKAVREGKPLIVWSGTEVQCPNCVRNNGEEFVHYIALDDDRFPKGSLTVAVPSQGRLLMAGQVRRWDDGHIPTVRKILRLWDAMPIGQRRAVRDSDIAPPGSTPWEGDPNRPAATRTPPAVSLSSESEPWRVEAREILARWRAGVRPVAQAQPRFAFGGRACAT